MNVTVVRYQTKPDRADENQSLVEDVFAGLAAGEPEGLRYVTLRLEDGVSFVHVAVLDGTASPEDPHPLTSTDAFQAFQRELGDRLEEGPVVAGATVVGSYGLPFDAAAAVAD